VENDLMVERWRNEKADAEKHETKSGALQSLAGRRYFLEEFLEDGLKGKSEQNLRAQY
jgi:hypothetical protein